MRRRFHAVVAIPARDERVHVARCLRAVRSSVREARRRGLVDRATVELTAHRCTDDTAAVAAQVLMGRLGGVLEDNVSTCVGAVRDGAVRRGLWRLGADPGAVWVLSSDADTTVGSDWVSQILTLANAHDAGAVVGLAALDRWRGGPDGRRAYEAVLETKMRDGKPHHHHDHVYGANLAIRGDVYLAAGGFPRVGHGEDQQLVDRVAAGGALVVRTRDIAVTTSGRFEGRAADGLADHLRRLDHDSSEHLLSRESGARPPRFAG